MFTTLWHGFLTFTFIGLGINWKSVTKYLHGESSEEMKSPLE
ncbi:hypothetical protein KGM_202461 [Danaus plexippus plexippus]|uniref:Uncharacterized protein n=1 Tax=Danaus plexippus plexippus TaxID=278856 RepID=A0A212FN50_DANPL|nr:hypothetical protein KGM_202461 [Danaus plexippus plexippus]